MTNSPSTDSGSDLQAAWRDGARALREGRAAEALERFGLITGAGDANAIVWVATAMAKKALGDRPAERAALAQALALDPRDLRALLMTADHYADVGDARAAASYYDAVVKVGAAAGSVEKVLEPDLARAIRMHEAYAEIYEAQLRNALGSQALDRPEARRVRRSLDLLVGKTELYIQQPRNFYFPELPNVEYADRAAFPWLDRVEAATDDIRAELIRILEEDSAFSPYVEAEPDRPFFDDHGMLGNPSWGAFYLWRSGSPAPENAGRCPAAMAALADAPLCRIPGRTPSILFSLLRPGAHVAPHHGFTNARFICHLPLIVPEGCAMRVGADTRSWAEGQACVFDDSIEHEAWNRNPDKLRVVMIFDVWRPELSATERELVSALLQAVDATGGAGLGDP
jgi:aspartyl/asparaginyl beta-hydroxylase (cupin superfamily)